MSRYSDKGLVTIAIDTRTNDGLSAEYAPIRDVMPLLAILEDLCGERCNVFFDFGVISFVNVDLAKVRQRFEGS